MKRTIYVLKAPGCAWRLEEPSPDDDQKPTRVLSTKHGEESSDDEVDVELLDSPPKRRQLEKTQLESQM